MAKQTVNLGTMADNKSGDPLRTAFEKINENFDELYASNGGGAVDLTAISTDIIPDTDVAYDLGSSTKRFRDLYLSGNTIDLGGAKISKTADGRIALPGVSRAQWKPSEIADYRADGQDYYNEIPLWAEGNPDNLEYVIVDQVFYNLIYNAADLGISLTDYSTPYPFTANSSGYITEIEIDDPDVYPSSPMQADLGFEYVNQDNMWVIPLQYNGQPVDLTSASQLQTIIEDPNSGAQGISAGVLSQSESVRERLSYEEIDGIPEFPTDISQLTDELNILAANGAAKTWTTNDETVWRIEEAHGGVQFNYNYPAGIPVTALVAETLADVTYVDIDDSTYPGFYGSNIRSFTINATTFDYYGNEWLGGTTYRYYLSAPTSYTVGDAIIGNTINNEVPLEPVKWWDSGDLPNGGENFRGAIIDYHAFSPDCGTMIGTIKIADDSGDNTVTHSEVASGGNDTAHIKFWGRGGGEGQLFFYRTDGEEDQNVKIQWTAKVFYGPEIWD